MICVNGDITLFVSNGGWGFKWVNNSYDIRQLQHSHTERERRYTLEIDDQEVIPFLNYKKYSHT